MTDFGTGPGHGWEAEQDDGRKLYRNEWKYVISAADAELLRLRLSPHLRMDSHASGGGYEIRSLYFDDYKNSAYEQKLMGVFERKKWRIRIYDYSDAKIALERKKKRGNYIYKESVDLSREEFDRILSGDFAFMLKRPETLCSEFYLECVTKLLRPKVIVDYYRTPLILKEGTVRITFDKQVCAAVGGFDIFDKGLPKLSVQTQDEVVLEVKFTEFLPQLVKELLPTPDQSLVAFSKYCACFERAHHLTDPTAGISKTYIGWRY